MTKVGSDRAARDPLAELGQAVLGVLLDPRSWQPGVVHDVLERRSRRG